jgi:hypothetical protein
MGKRIVILAALLLLGFDSRAAMTLVQRETFQTVGDLTSGTPGNLGSVTGTFSKRAVGPTAAGLESYGWSGCLSTATPTWHEWTMTGSETNTGMAGAWFFIGYYGNITGGNRAQMMNLTDTSSSGTLSVTSAELLANGEVKFLGYNTTAQTNVFWPATNQWFFLGVAWKKGNPVVFNWYTKNIGGALTQIGTNFLGNNASRYFARVGGGSKNLGGTARWAGRYGMFSVYSMSGLEDTAYPSDMTDPVSQRNHWYVNPATGNDSNSGALVSEPWAGIDKLVNEFPIYGIIPNYGGLYSGDVIHIDNTVTPLDLGTNNLRVTTAAGVTISNTGPVKAYATLSAGGWTKTEGLTNTYQTTDGAATDLVGCVVWEDDKWYSHPAGTWAAVSNSVDSVAGRFHSDGTNIYVHPFGSTNPGSDGKVYTRSRNRGASSSGVSAIVVTTPYVAIDGLQISKTCLARPADQDPYVAYCVQWDTGTGGTNVLSNFNVSYWSKHGVGMTANGSNIRLERINGVYGPGTPYGAAGSQSADVDFCNTGSNNSFYYTNVVCLNNAGVLGGTGTIGTSFSIRLSHGAAGAFSGGTFDNCNFCSTIDEGNITSGTIYVKNSTVAGISFGCDFEVDNSRTTFSPPSQFDSTKSSIIRNSFIDVTQTTAATNWVLASGPMTFLGCTIDTRANASVGGKSLWKKNVACSPVFTNCVFLVDPSKDFALLAGFSNTDTVKMDNNVYMLGSALNVMKGYNDGAATEDRTLTQWKALGFDTASVNQDPCIDLRRRPYAKTPCGNVGADLGPMTDYTGKMFQSRRTAGAYEYVIPRPQFIFGNK